MRQMLVIGLGRFGRNLAQRLKELGNEVMAVDCDEAIIERFGDIADRAAAADCMDPEVISSLDPSGFDVCFVCIGGDFQASLEITSLLKDAGADRVVTKTDTALHEKFLNKIGADEVIFPERDMAHRAAIKYTVDNVINYFELTPEYAIIEVKTPSKWAGKSIKSLDIRAKYRMNIIGVRVGDTIEPIMDSEYVFSGGEYLVIAGSKIESMHILGD